MADDVGRPDYGEAPAFSAEHPDELAAKVFAVRAAERAGLRIELLA